MSRHLSVDELLAGSGATHEVDVPSRLLPGDAAAGPRRVVVRPLTVKNLQAISRAAREDGVLGSVLMVQQALVEPRMTVEQAGELPAGLLGFLVDRVRELSGMALDDDELDAAVRAPLARACFVLAREFGWSTAECSDLTVGQVLLYLEMLARDEPGLPEGTAA